MDIVGKNKTAKGSFNTEIGQGVTYLGENKDRDPGRPSEGGRGFPTASSVQA